MKKVLFVTYDFPYPTTSGGKTRAYNMLKHSGKDIEKYLFSFTRKGFKNEYIKEIEEIGVNVADVEPRKKVASIDNALGVITGSSIFKSLYYSSKVADKIFQIVVDKKIDIVHFESFYTAYYISHELKKLGVKQIFGTENIEATLYSEYTQNNAPKLLRKAYEVQVKKIRAEEEGFFQKADLCIAVSNEEQEYIKGYTKECEVVRNGVDLNLFNYKMPSSKNGNKLLFVGNFTYFPNVDAINLFYKEIFKDLPEDVTLTVVGRKAEALPFKDKRIKYKEFVPRIQDEYEKADIMISPIRLGGGTNFKIIEAMAMGLPVVALHHRVGGLGIEDEKHMIVCDTPWDFIGKTKLLINDLEKRKKIAKSARDFVEREYSWKIIGEKLNKVWNKV